MSGKPSGKPLGQSSNDISRQLNILTNSTHLLSSTRTI